MGQTFVKLAQDYFKTTTPERHNFSSETLEPNHQTSSDTSAYYDGDSDIDEEEQVRRLPTIRLNLLQSALMTWASGSINIRVIDFQKWIFHLANGTYCVSSSSFYDALITTKIKLTKSRARGYLMVTSQGLY